MLKNKTPAAPRNDECLSKKLRIEIEEKDKIEMILNLDKREYSKEERKMILGIVPRLV